MTALSNADFKSEVLDSLLSKASGSVASGLEIPMLVLCILQLCRASSASTDLIGYSNRRDTN